MTRIFGPAGKIQLIMTPALSDLLLSHNKYQAELSHFDQYLIFRYTLGAGTINGYLINNQVDSDRLDFWTQSFFLNYNYPHYGSDKIPLSFQRWLAYFQDPILYRDLNAPERYSVGIEVLNRVIIQLQRIILSSPPTPNDIIVYKVSSSYPGLPSSQDLATATGGVVDVPQWPFNSTTVDPKLNFQPFLAPSSHCCLFGIRIPKGSQVLAISPVLHAYPFEKEVLLPSGSIFRVTNTRTELLTTLNGDGQRLIQIQKPPYVLGEVFQLDPAAESQVAVRDMNLFEVELQTPKIS